MARLFTVEDLVGGAFIVVTVPLEWKPGPFGSLGPFGANGPRGMFTGFTLRINNNYKNVIHYLSTKNKNRDISKSSVVVRLYRYLYVLFLD